MEDLNPSVQIGKQLGAGSNAESVSADPIPKSPGARWPMEESTAAADELGGKERLASMADKPAAVPGEMAGATGPLEVEAGVANAMPETRVEKPVVLEE